MYKYHLYKTAKSPEEEIEPVYKLLEEARTKHAISHSIIDIASLTDEQKEELLESIRLISRKNGKGVVSKGRGALPISRSGQPGNIGILLQLEDGKPKDVFPHLKNGKRISALMHLRELVEAEDVDEIRGEESLSEQDISRMITTLPELLEKGLDFVETEVETGGGRIDAVFRDKDGAYLLIEIELKANDNAIAQVQRFKIPYSEKSGLPLDKIRLGIVCADIGDSRLVACKGAGIEVYKLGILKLTS
ncbi:MAG TPA: endonuclease NucS domain-containing protein [Candidatus Methanoperedens sp.]